MRVLTFVPASTPHVRPSAVPAAASTKRDLRTLVDQIQILALERPAAIRVLLAVVCRMTARLRRHQRAGDPVGQSDGAAGRP